jgi:copper(I)-binding protein
MSNVNIRSLILLILLAFIITACGGNIGAEIQFEDAWVRAALKMDMQNQDDSSSDDEDMGSQMSGANSAAYMTIINQGQQADRLVSARSDVAQAVEIHISEMVGDIMTMHQVEGVDLPAGKQVELKPGGLHIMLIGINNDLNAGDRVALTLGFEKSGELEIEAEVRAP